MKRKGQDPQELVILAYYTSPLYVHSHLRSLHQVFVSCAELLSWLKPDYDDGTPETCME